MSSAYLEKSRVTQKVVREWMTHQRSQDGRGRTKYFFDDGVFDEHFAV